MKLQKNEIIFIIIIALALIFITELPYVYAYLNRGDTYYIGTNIFSTADSSVYYSYINQVKEGHVLLDDLFTNEVGGLKLFNIFWLIVGLVARIFQLSPPLAYHLFRIILIPVCLLVLYKFVAYLLAGQTIFRRKISFLYAIFATGIGGLAILLLGSNFFEYNPMDLWVAESSTFLTLLYSPHFIASLTLIVLTFYLFLRAQEDNNLWFGLGAGLSALILFNFHPFLVPLIYGVPLLYFLTILIRQRKVNWRAAKYYVLLVLISCPSVIYFFYELAINPALRIKAAQNICTTPGGVNFFLSYGFGLLAAIFATIYLWLKKNLSDKRLFLIVWFWLGMALLYGPFNFQRRLTDGLQVPLTILAFIALAAIYDKIKSRWPGIESVKFSMVTPVLIVLFCFSNFVVYSWNFQYLQQKPNQIFISSKIMQALDWYRNQTNLTQTLLSSGLIGNITPGLSGRRVFIGHGIETVNLGKKNLQLQWFYKDNSDDEAKKEFLKQNRIDYVFYSRGEKNIGSFDPGKKNYLIEVYKNNEAAIYQVNSN